MTNQLLNHLPRIYHEEKFLSIFETVLDQLDETIHRIPDYFDPVNAPAEFIPWLAQWFSLDLDEELGDKNREFILRVFDLYRKKGTIAGIRQLVNFLIGSDTCRVKEYAANVFRSWGLSGAGQTIYGGTLSLTVDDDETHRLARIGTPEDDYHYVHGGGSAGPMEQDVIRIYVERNIPENYKNLINSFLPVFIKAEIVVMEEKK